MKSIIIGEHKDVVCGIIFSNDEKFLFSYSHDHTIRKWDTNLID